MSAEAWFPGVIFAAWAAINVWLAWIIVSWARVEMTQSAMEIAFFVVWTLLCLLTGRMSK